MATRDDGLLPTEGRLFDLLSQNRLIHKGELIRLLPSYDAQSIGQPEVYSGLVHALEYQLSMLRKKVRLWGMAVACVRNGSEENTHYGLARLMTK